VSDRGVAVSRGLGRWRRAIGIVVSVALIVVAVRLAAVAGDAGDGNVDTGTAPHLVATGDLTALESSLGHPVYWAGERGGDRLELTEEAGGNVYLRYLPPGTEAGDPRQLFLTVGTYPVADPVAALRRTAAKAGTSLSRGPGGGVVLVNPSSRGSVYLAYPRTELQIEVYDSRPGRALGLIRAGAIGPVG
jgi:hypothetical protein